MRKCKLDIKQLEPADVLVGYPPLLAPILLCWSPFNQALLQRTELLISLSLHGAITQEPSSVEV